jgi:hypothetical protein
MLHCLSHYMSQVLLFLKLSEILIYFLLALLVVLEFFEPVRLVDEVFQLLKFWEFCYAIIEKPPEGIRLRLLKFRLLLSRRFCRLVLACLSRVEISATNY